MEVPQRDGREEGESPLRRSILLLHGRRADPVPFMTVIATWAGILAFTIVTCLESRIRWARGSCSTRPRTSCAVRPDSIRFSINHVDLIEAPYTQIRCPTAISAPVGQELIRLVARRLTETASRSSRLARARSNRSRVSEPALAARLTGMRLRCWHCARLIAADLSLSLQLPSLACHLLRIESLYRPPRTHSLISRARIYNTATFQLDSLPRLVRLDSNSTRFRPVCPIRQVATG